MAGVSSANIITANAVITLVGKSPTIISLTSDGSLLNISAGELVLGNNITLKGKNSNSRSLVGVMGSTAVLTMEHGAAIIGNENAGNYGGGVWVDNGGTFNMKGGTISGNSAGGGGVFVNSSGSFSKTKGFIGGDNDNIPHLGNGNATDNTAKAGNTNGHAVYYYKSGSANYYRDTALESGDDISTEASKLPANGTDFNWTKK
jgi:hypothetical protein